jgi:hypothetical protein
MPSGEPSLKERLSASFLAAFEADFKTNSIAVIERLRVEDPAKYVEVGAKLIAAVEQPAPGPDAFAGCKTQADNVGLPDGAATEDMLDRAVEAQLVLVAALERIAKGN